MSEMAGWALKSGCVAGLALALGSRALGATTLSIELPNQATAGTTAPAVLVLHDLPLPAGGATITVNAHLCYLRMSTPLTTLYVLGGGNGGTVTGDMRAAVEASPDFLSSLQNDPNATLTLTVCGNGGRACTTSAPFPIQFHR